MAAFPTSTVPVVGDVIICTASGAQGQPQKGGMYVVLGITATGFAVQLADSDNPLSAIQQAGVGPMTMPQNRIAAVIHTD